MNIRLDSTFDKRTATNNTVSGLILVGSIGGRMVWTAIALAFGYWAASPLPCGSLDWVSWGNSIVHRSLLIKGSCEPYVWNVPTFSTYRAVSSLTDVKQSISDGCQTIDFL